MPGRLVRVGLALVRPRWAVRVATDAREPGRSGGDLLAALLVVAVVAHARGLIAAGWLAVEVDVAVGLRAGIDVLAGAATVPLATFVAATVALALAAGPVPRGEGAGPATSRLGRAADAAGVAAIPVLAVELGAALLGGWFAGPVSAPVGWGVVGLGAAWAIAVTGLAIVELRRGEPAARPPRPVVVAARRAAGAAVVVAAATLVTSVGWVVAHLDTLRPVAPGTPLPALALPTVDADGRLGEPVRGDELRGRVVVIDFWATWCGPCLRALPELSALAARAAGRVEVLAIVLDDPAAARALFDRAGYRQRLLAGDDATSARFAVTAIPHVVVVDRDGIVRLVVRGDGGLREAAALAERLSK